MSDTPQPDDEMREDGFQRIERRLERLAAEVAAVRGEVEQLLAEIGEVRKRVRLLAGW